MIDGRSLMQALGLPQGPEVGRLLNAIEEARAAGEVKTREEALALATNILQQPTQPSRGLGEGATSRPSENPTEGAS